MVDKIARTNIETQKQILSDPDYGSEQNDPGRKLLGHIKYTTPTGKSSFSVYYRNTRRLFFLK